MDLIAVGDQEADGCGGETDHSGAEEEARGTDGRQVGQAGSGFEDLQTEVRVGRVSTRTGEMR